VSAVPLPVKSRMAEPFIIERNGSTMHFDVGFFPIGPGAKSRHHRHHAQRN